MPASTKRTSVERQERRALARAGREAPAEEPSLAVFGREVEAYDGQQGATAPEDSTAQDWLVADSVRPDFEDETADGLSSVEEEVRRAAEERHDRRERPPRAVPQHVAKAAAEVQREAPEHEHERERLRSRVAAARDEFESIAQSLTRGRERAATELSAAASILMRQLALASSTLSIALVPIDGGATAYGCESVEFRVSGLADAEARPLAKVVSGGELSRISLAIQVVASRLAQVPTLIFDEVDVGIGGGVAEIVGRMLRDLGRERQVLCITHLPQVAAQADWQWLVSKTASASGTRSHITCLDQAGRVGEIARMLGGVEITEITLSHARELLGEV